MTRLILAVQLLLLVSACRSIPEGLEPVTNFDSKQYLGLWYEIARFDSQFENNLDDVTANYSERKDGKIKVENRGFSTQRNAWSSIVGKAKFTQSKTVASLKVSFFGPFYAGYNVIALSPDYQYALVCGNTKDYLWILSRKKFIAEEVKTAFVNQAKQLGFATEKLVWVKHRDFE